MLLKLKMEGDVMELMDQNGLSFNFDAAPSLLWIRGPLISEYVRI